MFLGGFFLHVFAFEDSTYSFFWPFVYNDADHCSGYGELEDPALCLQLEEH